MKKDLKDGAKIFIVGVIIIALICAIIYYVKVYKESSIINASSMETSNSSEIDISSDIFIGKWEIDMGEDGFYTVEIGRDCDDELYFYWASGPFNGNYNKFEVTSYSIENNKLIVNIKELSEKHILYQENDKVYCTIENTEGTNFPVEMKKINDEVSIIGLDTRFRELEKAAIFITELNEKDNTFSCDLDNDGYLNKLMISTEKNVIEYDDMIVASDLFNEIDEYISHTVYAVDLYKDDSYLDIIIFSQCNGGHEYFILKNVNGKLELLDGNFSYALGVNNIEAYHIYVNNYNDMLWLNEVEANVYPMVTDSYYDLRNGIEEVKVDTSSLIIKDEEFETKEKVYFTTLESFGEHVYDYEDLKENHEILQSGTKFKILEIDETALKVELEDGRIGHIFTKYGHL